VGATEAVLAVGGAERTGCSPRRLDWGALAMPLPMLEEFAAALTAEAGHRPRPRAVGQSLQYIVAAEAFMEARLERPVSTEDLSAALGVPARRLHDAFRAAVDMSPHAYMKSRRMMLVRRALLDGECGPDLVKSVALGHGFWHLGHFAHDDRANSASCHRKRSGIDIPAMGGGTTRSDAAAVSRPAATAG
jgi:AraC-like DNA-binding protein